MRMAARRGKSTHGDGLEVMPVIAPDGTIAVLRADARAAAAAGGGEQATAR